jgi:serine/threonine protein kinase/beta-lactam-binding protein with PASTA domain
VIETTVDGRYQIVARIASGGMGEVYRAHDPVLDREVAIKILHTKLADDAGFIDRFRREARSAGMLSHPNIVAVHDWGETAGTYFMVMEFIRGPNLRTFLMRDGVLQPAQAAEVVSGVLAALEHAHEQGIVHRDIKPENVMVTRSGVVKVADFGLARAFADARVSQAPGTVTGTVQYLAPEQIEGERADPRTDLYATGIVLFELLTGQIPFTGETSLAIAYKHLRDRVPPPSRLNPMVPPALDRVVVGATDRDRDRRTPDARTMRAEVDRAAAELPPAPPLTELASSVAAVDDVPPDRASTVTIPRTLSPKARRRQRFRRVWAVLSVLVVLAAAGWAVWTYVVPHMAIVPRLEGRPVEQAQRVAVARGFDFEISRNTFSSTVDPGQVVSQSLPSGREVEEGSVLSVVVSKGPEFIDVPSVVGLPLGRAREEIQDARLTVGNVEKVFDNEVPKGEVIEQNPAGGQLEVDEAVDLTVSQGREPVDVPPVEGLPEGEAGSILTGADLRVSVDEDHSATVEEGNVISQSPQAGTVLRVGDTVTIVISLGPRRFPMPDVVGMTEAQATDRLEGLNLRVDAIDLPSGGNSVVGQRPEPGTTIEEGDKVTIFIGG